MAIDSAPLTRHVDLEAVFNVRDLGGYQGRAGQTLRWNRLLRADDLGRASPADLVRLSALGVRTIIDVRSDQERAESRPPTFRGAEVVTHHLPMLRHPWDDADEDVGRDPVDVLAERYLALLVEGAPAIADALRIMALPGAQPVVLHSTLGKDRAGLLSAVVLALLGVPTTTITEDYALSMLALAAHEDWLRRHDPSGRAAFGRRSRATLAAPPEAMNRVLVQVNDRCGSMVGFARGIGVEFEVIEALHRQLLA